MSNWGRFSKLRNKLIFYFTIVALLSFVILSAYQFRLCTAALKQQTLPYLERFGISSDVRRSLEDKNASFYLGRRWARSDRSVRDHSKDYGALSLKSPMPP